jgi:large subunit ribosomal protein L10e
MASIRPAKCYRKLERPNTRISKRKPRRSYVKGIPDRKIHKFEMGSPKKKYAMRAYLVSESGVQARHNALEAARITLNRHLEKTIGKDLFFAKILIFPHHVMRENPVATGAGADRFSTGMRKSFGKPIGLAARIRPNQRLIEVRFGREALPHAKDALRRAAAKFPTSCSIIVEEIK